MHLIEDLPGQFLASLPRLAGPDFIELLRRTLEHPHVPLVFESEAVAPCYKGRALRVRHAGDPFEQGRLTGSMPPLETIADGRPRQKQQGQKSDAPRDLSGCFRRANNPKNNRLHGPDQDHKEQRSEGQSKGHTPVCKRP